MKSISDIFITPKTRILDVIKLIDRSDVKIALVIGKRKRLVGTITDGDIRRGVLKGVSLQQTADKIMNPHPRFAAENEDRGRILHAMEQKRISHMPIVSKKGAVVGLEVLDDIIRPGIRNNWVVLMAGGLGTRLRPLTKKTPKPLLKVGSKPILETILENFIEHGFKKFYLAVNYKNEMLKKNFGDGSRWGVQIRYLEEDRRLGTAGALSLLPQKPLEPFFVMNGDLLTKINFTQLLEFHKENEDDATMCVREYDFQVPYGVVNIDRHCITGISEKPIHRFFVNAGIYLLEPRVLRLIPANTAIDMPHLFERILKKKCRVGAFPIREYWLDVGRIDDLERAHGDFGKHFGE